MLPFSVTAASQGWAGGGVHQQHPVQEDPGPAEGEGDPRCQLWERGGISHKWTVKKTHASKWQLKESWLWGTYAKYLSQSENVRICVWGGAHYSSNGSCLKYFINRLHCDSKLLLTDSSYSLVRLFGLSCNWPTCGPVANMSCWPFVVLTNGLMWEEEWISLDHSCVLPEPC